MSINFGRGGGHSVEFFFILSGFLLAYTYKPERNITDIATRNWVRFVPLVVVGSLLSNGGWSSFYGLFMLQYTGLAFSMLPNASAWYIGCLFWCSIFYLGLLKSCNSQSRDFIIGVIVFVSYLIIVRTGPVHFVVFDFIPHGMLRGLAGMGLGILLFKVAYHRLINQPPATVKTKFVYGIFELLLLLYVVFSFFTKKFFIEYWIFNPICYSFILMLFIAKKGFVSQFFEKPVWAKLAKYSLSIYLTHWCFYKNRFWQIFDDYHMNILMAVFFSIVLGVILHYLIEKPSAKLLFGLIKR